MSSNQSGSVVRDDPDNHRYVLEVDGEPAGVAVYHVRNGRYIFVHTEVDPRLEGRGMGSELARRALDDMKARGEVIVPICPFISAYVKRHPEYDEIVDQALLDKINGTVGDS